MTVWSQLPGAFRLLTILDITGQVNEREGKTRLTHENLLEQRREPRNSIYAESGNQTLDKFFGRLRALTSHEDYSHQPVQIASPTHEAKRWVQPDKDKSF